MEHITNGKIKTKCVNCGIEFIKWKAEFHKENFHKRSCYIEYIRKGKHSVIGQSAEKHPNWKGGRSYINADGYKMIWAFRHPRSHQNIIPEHTIVMEKKLGRFLKPQEEVHHLNHIRDDNRPENLILCANHSEHLRNHKHLKGKGRSNIRRNPKNGRFI